MSQNFSVSSEDASASWEPRTIAALFKLELDAMLLAWEASKPLRTGAPHASAILSPKSEWCVRRQVLLAREASQAERPPQKPWTAHQNAVFLNGWHLHEKYQRLFQQFGTVIVREVEVSHFDEERFLHFTPDAIIEFYGQPFVVEIKGYHTEYFASLDESGNPPQAAWHQCNLYCHLLNIEYGLVLVEDKNTQQVKIWAIRHNPTLARVYTDRCYAVKGAIISDALPSRVCASCTDRMAEKCPVRFVCFR
jgi:hypothetical protein